MRPLRLASPLHPLHLHDTLKRSFCALRILCAVAEDGTLRRIANWASLSERERQVALRRIGQRNQVRISARLLDYDGCLHS